MSRFVLQRTAARAASSSLRRPACALKPASASLGVRRNFSAATHTGKLACLDLEGVLIPEVWVSVPDFMADALAMAIGACLRVRRDTKFRLLLSTAGAVFMWRWQGARR